MRIVLRPLAPREIDYELVALSVSVSALLFGAAWFALHLPTPICAFHALTGHPCITCGATRSAIAFCHGNLPASWKWNPLAFASYCALSGFNAYAIFAVVMGGPRLRVAFLSQSEKRRVRMIAIAALALNWIYLLAHSSNF